MRIVGTKGLRLHVEFEESENRAWQEANILGGVSFTKGVYTIDDNIINRMLGGHGFPEGQSQHAGRQWNLTGLKDFQVRDVQKAQNWNFYLNRNKMGYGKTVETIVVLRERQAKNCLIIVPKSIRLQWVTQFNTWWPERKDVTTVVKSGKVGGILVLNYEQVVKHEQLLRSILWDEIVCDEAHRIKNRDSKRTIAVKRIPAVHRTALTGTPIYNKPDDLYSILHFLHPVLSGHSYWAFVNKFCDVEETFWGKKISGLTKNPHNVEQLRALLEMCSIHNPELHLTKGREYIDVPIEMTPSQKKMLTQVKKLAIEELAEQGISLSSGLVKLLRLQQISSEPATLGIPGGNPKVEWILDLLDCNPEKKIVVFSRFSTTINFVAEELQKHKHKTTIISGEVADREEAKGRFTRGDCDVLLGTIGAMGEGLDELQFVTDTVIFIDKTWNPEEINQCIGRVDRIGQQGITYVYTLIGDKIDEKIGRVHLNKLEDIKECLS